MTYVEALRDASLTVRAWLNEFTPSEYWCAMHFIALGLRCHPTWAAIEDEIVRRLIAEDEPLRLAA
jgi:hypothetical protein